MRLIRYQHKRYSLYFSQPTFPVFILWNWRKYVKTKESGGIGWLHYAFTEYGNANVGRPRTGAGARFSLLHSAQCGSGAHPAHCPVCVCRRPLSGGEVVQGYTDQSSPSDAVVKNTWSYNSTPPSLWCRTTLATGEILSINVSLWRYMPMRTTIPRFMGLCILFVDITSSFTLHNTNFLRNHKRFTLHIHCLMAQEQQF
jgi:hypothetical protein